MRRHIIQLLLTVQLAVLYALVVDLALRETLPRMLTIATVPVFWFTAWSIVLMITIWREAADDER